MLRLNNTCACMPTNLKLYKTSVIEIQGFGIKDPNEKIIVAVIYGDKLESVVHVVREYSDMRIKNDKGKDAFGVSGFVPISIHFIGFIQLEKSLSFFQAPF